MYLFRRMNKIGLKNVDCGSACASLHQAVTPDWSRLFAFHTPLPPKPQLLVVLWKAQIICFSHHTLPDAASSFAHHLKSFYHEKLQLFKSHSCLFIHLTCITFKWIQNLCWSPRIWTTESRYSTFISFHQILQLQISNSIQTLNFTCKYKVFKQLHSTQQGCKTWSMWKPGKLWKL